jgi:hypothetical protein
MEEVGTMRRKSSRGSSASRAWYDARNRNRRIPADVYALGRVPETDEKVFLTFDDLVTHVGVEGPTGEGKSKQLQRLARPLLARSDIGGAIIDGHGDFTEDLKRDAYAMGMADRVVPIDFNLDDILPAFNPFAGGVNHAVEAARDVELLNRVFRSDHSVVLKRNRWIFSGAYAVRAGGGPFTAIEDVLAPAPTDVGVALCDQVDVESVRQDLEWINEASEYQRSDKIESSINQLRTVLANSRIRLSLAQLRGLDPARVIDERKLLLVNLRPGTHLSLEASRLMGNLIVSALCREAMRRPQSGRVPFFLMIDEAARFATDEIAEILTGGRKFLFPLVLSWQYDAQWRQNVAGTMDDSVLEAIRSCCRTHIVFGGQPPQHVRPMAERAGARSFDPHMIKDQLEQTKQHVARFETVTLSGRAQHTGGGTAAGEAVPFSGGIFGAEGSDYGIASVSESYSESMSESEHEALMPVYETFREVSNRTFWSFEEWVTMVMQKLVALPKQHAALFKKTGEIQFYRVDDVVPAAIDEATVAAYDRRVFTNPDNPYVSVAAAQAAYDAWRSTLTKTVYDESEVVVEPTITRMESHDG